MSVLPAGTGTLLRLAVRRDRVLLGTGAAVLTALVVASAASVASLYPSAAAREQAVAALDANGAVVFLYGPVLDTSGVGDLAMSKLTVVYAAFVALLAAVVVRRQTRTEEEAGRAELVAGTAAHRSAPLAAATLEGVALSVAIGLLAAVADAACGLSVAGSLLFGGWWAGAGLVGVGLAVLAAQLSSSTRTVGAVVAAGLGLAFVVRGVADVVDGLAWLGWVSPLGWGTRLQAWQDPRPWVLLLPVAVAAVGVATGVALRGRRDLGAGLVAARPGPVHGPARLGGVLGLTARLQRTTIATWTVALAAGGAVVGSIVPSVGDLLDGSGAQEVVTALGGTDDLEKATLAACLSIMAALVTCFAVGVVARARTEEEDGRTAQLLAGGVSRRSEYGTTVVVALAGSAWLLLALGLGVLVALGSDADAVGGAGRVVLGALVQVPAVWLVSALTVAAFAVRSRLAVVGWALVVGFLTLREVGASLDLPSWATGLSPYDHTPQVPAEAVAAAPLLTMTALAAAALALGGAVYRRRDVG